MAHLTVIFDMLVFALVFRNVFRNDPISPLDQLYHHPSYYSPLIYQNQIHMLVAGN